MKFQLTLVITLVTFLFTWATPIPPTEIQEMSAQGLRLLSLTHDADPIWKTEAEKLELMRKGIKFFDVTEVYEDELSFPPSNKKVSAATFPPPSHQSEVKPIIETLSIENMQSNLGTLSAFNNRYYKSSTGAEASAWILSTVQNIANSHPGVNVSAFKHSWAQSSTIARIPGKNPNDPVVILGAHMDSINLNNPSSGRAPGADDDGTGTVNLIEAFRALLAAGFSPSSPVEFHWYSGEEGGLLGSQAIVTSYKKAGVQVKASMQLDMTGYFKPSSKEVVALLSDYVDDGLTTFLKSIVETYTRLSWVMDKCGYACSDHASWNKAGYPASLPFEAVSGNDDPRIHTEGDSLTQSGFSWAHSLEFAKIAVAFVYELAI